MNGSALRNLAREQTIDLPSDIPGRANGFVAEPTLRKGGKRRNEVLAAVLLERGWLTPSAVEALYQRAQDGCIPLEELLLENELFPADHVKELQTLVSDRLREARKEAALSTAVGGSVTEPVLPFGVPSRLGPYAIQGVLGQGGMGLVLEGLDERLDRRVAIKVLRGATDGSEAAARFCREARVVAELRHPAIVGVYQIARSHGNWWYSMGLVEDGMGLDTFSAGRQLPEQEAARLLLPVAEALQYVHSRRVVHRDIKPQNILIDRWNQVRLTDFGLVSHAGATTLTTDGTILGTPCYMAPEQACGERATPATDVFGLGATLYYLLCGRPPYQGEDLQAIHKQAITCQHPAPEELNPNLSRAALEMIRSALAPLPTDRPSAEELVEQLRLLSAPAEHQGRDGRRLLRLLMILAATVLTWGLLQASGILSDMGNSPPHMPQAFERNGPGAPVPAFREGDGFRSHHLFGAPSGGMEREAAGPHTPADPTTHPVVERTAIDPAAGETHREQQVTSYRAALEGMPPQARRMAEGYLQAVLSQYPGRAMLPPLELGLVWCQLGTLLQELQQLDGARYAFERARGLVQRRATPGDGRVWFYATQGLATVAYDTNCPDLARDLLQEALREADGVPPHDRGMAFLRLAQAHLANGNPGAARAAWEGADEVSAPSLTPYIDQVARQLRQAGVDPLEDAEPSGRRF